MARLGSAARHKNFALLWTAQFISVAGSSLGTLAAGVVVYRATGSALDVGLIMIATVLPSLGVGAIAAVLVDRADRRHVMIGADLVRAVLVTSIPFLIGGSLTWLYVVILLVNTAGQFFNPAAASLLQETVTDEELPAANALSAISSLGSPSVGFAVAGLIAAGMPMAVAFYLNGVCYVLSAACNWHLYGIVTRAARRTQSIHARDLLSDAQEGMGFVWRSAALRMLLLICVPALVAIGLSETALLPFARDALHESDGVFGLLRAANSFGLICGSLILVRVGSRLPAGRWLAISFVGMGITGYALSASASVAVTVVCAIGVGLANAPLVVACQLIIQRSTPRELRGRVNGAFLIARDLTFVVGMAAVGLADIVDVRLLLGAAFGILALCGLAALRVLAQPRERAKIWQLEAGCSSRTRITSPPSQTRAAPRWQSGVPSPARYFFSG
jgi:MFS family permease